MHRPFWFTARLSFVIGVVVLLGVVMLLGAVLILGGCGSSSPATTGASASTSVTEAPLITASTASTSTTAAAGTTPTSKATTGKVGTQENPVPLGKEGTVGNWKIEITSADLDADAAVKSAPGYQPPDSSSQYVLVKLDATYTGEAPDSFANGLGVQIVASNGDTFDSVDLGLDNSIQNSSALVKDASASGTLVFAVPSDQIDGAMLWLAPSSFQEEKGTFFALK